jgi:hypothetical protein
MPSPSATTSFSPPLSPSPPPCSQHGQRDPLLKTDTMSRIERTEFLCESAPASPETDSSAGRCCAISLDSFAGLPSCACVCVDCMYVNAVCMHACYGCCMHACVFVFTFFLAWLSTTPPHTHPTTVPVFYTNPITAARQFYALVSASTAPLKAAVCPRFELVLLPAGDEMRLLKGCVSCCSEEQWRLCRLAVFLLPASRHILQPTLHPLTTHDHGGLQQAADCAQHSRVLRPDVSGAQCAAPVPASAQGLPPADRPGTARSLHNRPRKRLCRAWEASGWGMESRPKQQRAAPGSTCSPLLRTARPRAQPRAQRNGSCERALKRNSSG